MLGAAIDVSDAETPAPWMMDDAAYARAVVALTRWHARRLARSGVTLVVIVVVVGRGVRGDVVAGAAWVVIVVAVVARGGVVAGAAWVVIVVVVVVVRGGVAGAAWVVILCASGEVRPWAAGPVVNTCPAARALP